MSASREIVADICVIGGGPAGSTVAHRLASLGHEVCLVEAQAFPRSHIGASLNSSILPLLECIGARKLVENAGFPKSERTVLWWSRAIPTIRSQPGPPGLHVDRGKFDHLLLENAKRNGVTVLQPARARRPQRLDRGGWRIRLDHDGEAKQVSSRFVVDASGGQNLLPGRRIRNSAPLLTMYAHWAFPSWPKDEARVEAGQDEWFWCAPLGPRKAVAAVFIDPKRLSGISRGDLTVTYCKLLERFRLFRENPAGHVEGAVKVCDASSRCAEHPVGPDFIKVGDSNLALDPLSSQGVQSAVATALQAAVVINTVLRRPENQDVAVAFYRARQQERNQQHTTKTAEFYAERAAVCDRPFWRRRMVAASVATTTLDIETRDLDGSQRIQVSEAIQVKAVPTMHGDLIVPAAALHHDALDRPVAFVGGVEIVPLLKDLRPGRSVEEVIQSWSGQLPADLSYKIIEWLWSRNIVEPFAGDECTGQRFDRAPAPS